MFTLFPRQPMVPQPTQDTLGCPTKRRRSDLTQTLTNIPTICLLMIHLKSGGVVWLDSSELPSLYGYTFCLSEAAFNSNWFLLPCFKVGLVLFKAALIKEFHFVGILVFSVPSMFLALNGTISWNLQSDKQS